MIFYIGVFLTKFQENCFLYKTGLHLFAMQACFHFMRM